MSRHDDLLRQLDGVCVDLADVGNALRGRSISYEQLAEISRHVDVIRGHLNDVIRAAAEAAHEGAS